MLTQLQGGPIAEVKIRRRLCHVLEPRPTKTKIGDEYEGDFRMAISQYVDERIDRFIPRCKMRVAVLCQTAKTPGLKCARLRLDPMPL